MKSPDATLSSGAIGATVNIKFPKPFDNPGFKLVGRPPAPISPEQGNVTPNADFLFSDTFNNDTFGILIDARLYLQPHQGQSRQYPGLGRHPDQSRPAGGRARPAPRTTNNINAWFIQDYGLYQETTTETRMTARLALQWRPAENLLITLNDNYNRDTLHAVSMAIRSGSIPAACRMSCTSPNGTITSFTQPGTPTDFQSQINGSIMQNNEFGLNVKWDADRQAVLHL